MGILLTQDSRFLIGPIAKIMGIIMNAIFEVLNVIGIQNIGLCIILFTIIIYTLMLPIQIKQQKFTKISSIMNPELQAIQKKYQNKKDQASMLKMQEETKMVYQKYGASPMGGCLGSLIQLPFLFALWPVIQNIPAYVSNIKEAYMPLVNEIKDIKGYEKIMQAFAKDNSILVSAKDYSKTNTLVDVLYKFQDGTWEKLAEKFPELADLIEKTEDKIAGFNYFPTSSFGINIAETPSNMLAAAIKDFSILAIIVAILIPVLAGLTQWINAKLSQSMMNSGNKKQEENSMAQQMNSMMKIMPLMSVVFCFTMPVGLGLYWIASAVVRTIQQIFINKQLNKKSINDIVKENAEKNAKKLQNKNQVDAKNVNSMATKYTKKIDEMKAEILADAEKKESKVNTTYSANAKPGSLAARANMVSEYNKRNNK